MANKVIKSTFIVGLIMAAAACLMLLTVPQCAAFLQTKQHQTASAQNFYNQECVFCKIIARQAPAKILYENDHVIAIEKREVKVPVDCLIIPKKHVPDFRFLDLNNPEDAAIPAQLVEVIQILSKRLTGSQDFRIEVNNGPNYQEIPHLHLHFKSKERWPTK